MLVNWHFGTLGTNVSHVLTEKQNFLPVKCTSRYHLQNGTLVVPVSMSKARCCSSTVTIDVSFSLLVSNSLRVAGVASLRGQGNLASKNLFNQPSVCKSTIGTEQERVTAPWQMTVCLVRCNWTSSWKTQQRVSFRTSTMKCNYIIPIEIRRLCLLWFEVSWTVFRLS